MENTVEEKPKGRVGNPALIAKKDKPVIIHDMEVESKKIYRFQLCQSYDDMKPKDAKTGLVLDNPYPPYKMAINEGRAINPTTNQLEQFRYMPDYPSIWVKDQQSPKPTPAQLNADRDIIFRHGFLSVKGVEVNKLMTLMIQDGYEGHPNKVNPIVPEFRLIDEGKERSKLRSSADKRYEAEKAVREAEIDLLFPVAALFGISTDDPEQGGDWIRTQLILKANTPPTKNMDYQQTIIDALSDPMLEVKALVSAAQRDNVITMTNNIVTWTSTGNLMLELNSQVDVPSQVARKYSSGDEKAAELVQLIKDHG